MPVTTTMTLPTPNGDLAVTRYSPEEPIGHTMVISSATGVLQGFYTKFALFCAQNGICTYTFDYRGIGQSGADAATLKSYEGGVKAWGHNDQKAVLALAKKEHPDKKKILVTHSIGGQLLGFNPEHQHLHKIVMIAAQSGYWKMFKGIDKLRLFAFWHVLIPVFTPLFGYFPAKKLGLFENIPKSVILEWQSWGKKPNYMMHFKNDIQYFFDKVTSPILAYSFTNDHFASKAGVDWMMSQYKNAPVKRIHFSKNEEGAIAGHFGFFRERFKQALWLPTLNWILQE